MDFFLFIDMMTACVGCQLDTDNEQRGDLGNRSQEKAFGRNDMGFEMVIHF